LASREPDITHEPRFAPNAGAHLPWYLAQLKPNGYERAVTNLHHQHVTTFMPLCKKSDARGKSAATAPLFPGYLFLSFDPKITTFTTINSTFGVGRIVTTGCNIENGLPRRLIEGMQARCDIHGHFMPLDDLKLKENVRITAGPFKNFVAVVEQLKSAERVQVLFEIMGQAVHAEVPTYDLERAVAS